MDGKTIIYPVFLPHAGCPFQCVYCNQNAVTRVATETGAVGTACVEQFVRDLAERSERQSRPGEIAFYGGTFTALPESTMTRLLDAAADQVAMGRFTGIRFSTRPDCLSDSVCTVLDKYPVQTVELGAQSLSDEVLHRSQRGYSEHCVRRAANRVRECGWALGIQIMPGLPGDTPDRFLRTVKSTVELHPDFVRLYPTIVLRGTILAEWFRNGEYRPLSLEDAVWWCAQAQGIFLAAGIRTARMGLHADPELMKSGNILAGPFHPSFGYLVRVRQWRDRIDRRLHDIMKEESSKSLVLTVPAPAISEVVGPGRTNLAYWKDKWKIDKLSVKGSSAVSPDYLDCSLE